LKTARQALAHEESLRAAHEAANDDVRVGLERMLAAADTEVGEARASYDAALQGWIDAESQAADRRYADAILRAEAELRRTFALVALARRRNLKIASMCADYADDFVAPTIGVTSMQQAEGGVARSGVPMRRISRHHLKRADDDRALVEELEGIAGPLP